MPSLVSQGCCCRGLGMLHGTCQTNASRQEPGLWLRLKQSAPQLSCSHPETRCASIYPAAKGTLQRPCLNAPELSMGSLPQHVGSKIRWKLAVLAARLPWETVAWALMLPFPFEYFCLQHIINVNSEVCPQSPFPLFLSTNPAFSGTTVMTWH